MKIRSKGFLLHLTINVYLETTINPFINYIYIVFYTSK